MDKKLLDEKIIIFSQGEFNQRIRAVLAKHCVENQDYHDKLIQYFVNKAWCDMASYERRKKGSNVIKNKLVLQSGLVHELIGNVTTINKDFDKWHESLCTNSEHDMRYGLWQKLINMAFKDMYCAKDFFPEYASVWGKCHCPIDSVITGRVLKEYPEFDDKGLLLSISSCGNSGKVSWNFMSKEDYLAIQSIIRKVCKKEDITPLEVDFWLWGR